MDITEHPTIFAWLTIVMVVLVPLVGVLLRMQINNFVKILDSKVDAGDVDKVISERIKKSEDWSGVTFVLSKLFEQYTVETKDHLKAYSLFSAEAKKENYEEHNALRTEIARNKDAVLLEIQTGFSGIRAELTNIRKVASDQLVELLRDRNRGNPGMTMNVGTKE